MKTILVIVLALIILTGLLWVFKDLYVMRKWQKVVARKYDVMKPLIRKFDGRKEVTAAEIEILSKDPALRHAVYRILEKYGRLDLFPSQYYTCERGAESYLVNWLEFPTELGSSPDEIELFKKVTLEEMADYYVFKFRADSPEWASHHWMFGICGPYEEKTLPFDLPRRIFSRFNKITEVSAETEVKWVHENI
jgi:hypothetical protein